MPGWYQQVVEHTGFGPAAKVGEQWIPRAFQDSEVYQVLDPFFDRTFLRFGEETIESSREDGDYTLRHVWDAESGELLSVTPRLPHRQPDLHPGARPHRRR